MTGRERPATPDMGAMRNSDLGRLLYAVAASAALCAPAGLQAAEPKVTVQGEMDPDLKAMVERVIGETDRPIENRFEARRRARAARRAGGAHRHRHWVHQIEPRP